MPTETLRLDPPEPLKGAATGSFAHSSIVDRLPRILSRVLEENSFPQPVVDRLQALRHDIPEATIARIDDPGAPDEEAWNGYIAEREGEDWLTVPWFFAETYFYRRIVAATGYFSGPLEGVDPFAYQKTTGLETSGTPIRSLATELQDALRQVPLAADDLVQLLAVNLWGNRADLSLWPADADDAPDDHTLGADHILADHRQAFARWITKAAPIDEVLVIADNAGFELVGDLALIDALLAGDLTSRVTIQTKIHPTFVSDAVIGDVEDTIDFLCTADDPAVLDFGVRLRTHKEAGRLRVTDDPFWTSPLPTWRMPDALRSRLAEADVVISKGDANYRRLLGDRQWDFRTPFNDIVAYMPTRLLALRTIKAELAAGLGEDALRRARSEDDDWLTNGRWGVIQFAS